MIPIAQAGDSFREFFEAFEQFFENLAAIQWGSLTFAMLAFVAYLTLRSRASFHILRDHQRLGSNHRRLEEWIRRVDAHPRA